VVDFFPLRTREDVKRSFDEEMYRRTTFNLSTVRSDEDIAYSRAVRESFE
jgi:hypothetical protein